MSKNIPIWFNRFFSKIKITKSCWIWEGGKFTNGYGSFKVDGKNERAHRLSYLIFKGEIYWEFSICHTCDNRQCVNPEHLFAGTAEQNQQDAKNKNRTLKGEKHHNVKLTKEIVIEIRKTYKTGLYSISELAQRYELTHSGMSNIIHKRTWK